MSISEHSLVIVQSAGRQTLRIVLSEPLDVGRDCEGLIVTDPAVSRRHLMLAVGPTPGTVEVTDLNSSNGSFVASERIEGTEVLEPGQSVRLGDCLITVAQPYAMGDDSVPNSNLTVIDSNESKTSIDRIADSVAGNTPAASRESGTLTIVFSDIENSTSMASSMGDALWMELLARHQEQVERHVKAQRGRIIKNQGDGFMLTFQSARQAVLASIALQTELAEDPEIAIRIGMHTGEGLMDRQGDIFGLHVNKAARIGAIANGGQILVSDLVKRITATRGDLRFGEPIQAVLKGITEPAIVYEVLWRDDHP